MSIQVIQYKQNNISIRIVLINQPLDLMCPINLGPVLFCIYIPIFAKRLIEHENAAGSLADIF